MSAAESGPRSAITNVTAFQAPSVSNPVAALTVLGAYLRHLRTQQGLTIKQVAPKVHASISKISRIEGGEHSVKDCDVFALLSFYEVTDPEHLEGIRDLLEVSRRDPWWQAFSDVTPGWFRRLIGLEACARCIRTYEWAYVPGLLQTQAYARAIVERGLPPGATAHEVDQRVLLRLTRQLLLKRAGSPDVLALMDESVLRRPYGGPAVMCEQLEYLRDLTRRDGINLRFIPYDACMTSVSLTYLAFPPGGLQDLIYLEASDHARYLNKPEEVESYKSQIVRLQQAAASRGKSLELLDAAIARYRA
ncbi:helix-turn-helix domain-containing protein [Streptomyces chrestomyceticus]|uniref:helix-turn-helix domain-containing protein n=1 Tax=Streptomyces chrestomyceticus TaxID=68185 RepID=UPI0033FF4FE6